MQENIKDPYHPGLLHTWFVTFGLWRADNKSATAHGLLITVMRPWCPHEAPAAKPPADKAHVTQVIELQGQAWQLNDPRFSGHRARALVATGRANANRCDDDRMFPSVIFQQQVNSVSTRHIQPDGHGAFDFVWTHFGFRRRHPEEMTQRRLRQANLFGPAGFVSADDGEVIEWSQASLSRPNPRTARSLQNSAAVRSAIQTTWLPRR